MPFERLKRYLDNHVFPSPEAQASADVGIKPPLDAHALFAARVALIKEHQDNGDVYLKPIRAQAAEAKAREHLTGEMAIVVDYPPKDSA